MTALKAELRRWPLDETLPRRSAWPDGRVDAVTDLSRQPRLGLRSKGTADFARANGLPLPDALNISGSDRGVALLRLGADEILLLADPTTGGGGISQIYTAWDAAPAPKGVDAWRDETWAWFSLTGPGALVALRRITAADTRPSRFKPGMVLQTRGMHMDTVIYRSDWGGRPSVDLFFDVASSQFALDFLHDVLPGFDFGRYEGEGT